MNYVICIHKKNMTILLRNYKGLLKFFLIFLNYWLGCYQNAIIKVFAIPESLLKPTIFKKVDQLNQAEPI